MQNLVADVGFGDVKLDSDGVPQKFPTIIVPEPIRSGSIDFGEGVARAYECAGVRYIVGDDAIRAILGGAAGGNIQRNTSWLVGRMPILTQHAAYLAGIENMRETSQTIGQPLAELRSHENGVVQEL